MNNFNLKKFLIENQLTVNSRNLREQREPLPSHIVRQLYTIVSLYDSKKDDPEFGDWTVDPTHVYEHFLEIFDDYDIEVTDNFREFQTIVKSTSSNPTEMIRKAVEALTPYTLPAPTLTSEY